MVPPVGQGSIVSVHVFEGGRARAPVLPGLVFAKRLLPIGSAASGGFGAGLPPLRRRVLLAVWEDLAAFRPLGTWCAAGEAYATRGTFGGERRIAPAGPREPGGPISVIKLGRPTPRTLVRFLRRGEGLASHTRDAPGLITAVSAGIPLSGNLTFSLWESERAMTDFAYGRAADHRAVVRDRPPILAEQLNARLRPLRVEGALEPRRTLHPERLSRFAEALRTGPRA